jgi:O-antigen/teichoic acid export membrane protein
VSRWGQSREVGYYLATRTANGLLALLNAYVVIAVLGESEAGRYFLFWTAAWILSVVMRLGVDGVMPRVVAEAGLAGGAVPSLRPAVAWSVAVGALSAPCVLFALGLSQAGLAAVACLLVSAAWGLTHILGSLLRASHRVAWSGVVINVVWAVGAAAAPLGLLVTERSWLSLAWLTVLTSLLAVVISVVVVVRVIGARLLRELVARASDSRLLDRDTLGAACVGVLAETTVWLPVLLAAVFGNPVDVAVVFAATRLAGPFSWAYQAVVAALSPRLAAALAARRLDRVRRLLRVGAGAGVLVTLPLCAIGIALAPQLIELLLGHPSPDGATVLRLLIGARAIDALTGPVGESLLIGRRTWADVGLLSAAIAGGVAITAGLDASEPVVFAAGAGAAAAFVLANALRLLVVRRLLRHEWTLAIGAPARGEGAALVLVSLAAATSAVAWTELDGYTRIFFALAGSALLIAGSAWWAGRRLGARALLFSPAGLALGLIATHFTLRPAAITADPSTVATGLIPIGFTWADVAEATSLGALGFAALVFGYASRAQRDRGSGPRLAALPDTRRIVVGATATLAVGSLLWGALFFRIGGVHVLLTDPGALHLNQFGGAYGTFGMLLCLGSALVLLWAWLQHPSRALAWTLGGAAAVCGAASVALASRGPLFVTVLAAALLVARYRRPKRRTLVIVALAGAVLFGANSVVREARQYAHAVPIPEAVRSALTTDPLVTLSGDLIEFDHAVGVVTLIPERLSYLDGESLLDIPRAFVPRALDPSKPKPIDFRLSAAIYGPGAVAGTPPTLPGELYWNFGLVGALLAMAICGGILGEAGRRLTRAGPFAALAWCVIVAYCYTLFTRPLAFMLQLMVMALVALCVAATAMGLIDPRAAAAGLLRRRGEQRVDQTPVAVAERP